MPNFLFGNRPAGGQRDLLRTTDDAINSTRLNKCAGSFGSRGSGGATMFTPTARLIAPIPGHPYKGYDASSGSTPQVVIQIGSHNGVVPTVEGTAMSATLEANLLTLDSSNEIVYVELDVVSGTISTAEIFGSDLLSPPANTVSGGTGAAYQVLFYTVVTISGSIAHVAVSDNVSGSQAYQNCADTALYGLV